MLYDAVTDEIKQNISRSKAMLKGRIAEVLVEGLFKILGYQVHRYGMEHAMPTLLRDLQQFRGHKIIDRVRALPDFIITHQKSKKAFEIEVKYREMGSFKLSDVLEKYPTFEHVGALFIVVSPTAIKCLSFDELSDGKEITEESIHFLHDRPEFLQSSLIIKYYEGYLRNVMTKGLKEFPDEA